MLARYTKATTDDDVFEAASCIELEEFEHVEAAPRTVLLRLSFRPSAGVVATGPSTLVVADGPRLHRLSPLPAPPGTPDLLRFAYSAPLSLLDGHAAFALELHDGSVLDLPAPTQGRSRIARHELEQHLQAEWEHRADAEDQVAELEAIQTMPASPVAEPVSARTNVQPVLRPLPVMPSAPRRLSRASVLHLILPVMLVAEVVVILSAH